MKQRISPTSLSSWFPIIEAAGIPVPKTIILEMPEDAQKDMWEMFDGKAPGEAIKLFAKEIADKAVSLGFPLFLRTNETSGKHNWKHTCFVEKPEDVLSRVYGIAEFSEIADFMGMPWHTWVLREMLPTIPFGICPRYGDMPICREFRFFVEDGEIKCSHPYWPLESLIDGGAENIDYKELRTMPDEALLNDLAVKVGKAIPGAWSVDLLETKRGWFVTDMAEAHKSYHWPECEKLPSRDRVTND